EDVHPFFGRDDRIAVEIGGALLELGEVLNAGHGALGAEASLDVHAAKRWGLDAMAKLLWPYGTDQMRGAVRVAVHVAVETGHASTGLLGSPILGLVELLLGKRGHQKPEAFELLGIEHPVEQLVEVHDRDQLSLGHIAQVRAGRQKD